METQPGSKVDEQEATNGRRKDAEEGKEKHSTKNLEYVFLSVTTTQHTFLLLRFRAAFWVRRN